MPGGERLEVRAEAATLPVIEGIMEVELAETLGGVRFRSIASPQP